MMQSVQRRIRAGIGGRLPAPCSRPGHSSRGRTVTGGPVAGDATCITPHRGPQVTGPPRRAPPACPRRTATARRRVVSPHTADGRHGRRVVSPHADDDPANGPFTRGRIWRTVCGLTFGEPTTTDVPGGGRHAPADRLRHERDARCCRASPRRAVASSSRLILIGPCARRWPSAAAFVVSAIRVVSRRGVRPCQLPAPSRRGITTTSTAAPRWARRASCTPMH